MLSENIKRKIEEEYGGEIKYPKDCEALARDIFKKCGKNISASTLKRYFGFDKSNLRSPHKYTLDIIAKYVGYSDWDALQKDELSPEIEKQDNEKDNEKPDNRILPDKVRVKPVIPKQAVFILVGIIAIIICAGIYRNNRKKDSNSQINDDWKYVQNMPECRSALGLATYKGYLYAMGGGDAVYSRTDTWVYDGKKNEWKAKAPSHVARGETGCAALQGKIYVFGGWVGDSPTDTAEVYDIEKDKWDALPKVPVPITSVAAVAYKNKVYILGGTLGVTKTYFYEFDLNKNAYKLLNNFSTIRNFARLVVLNDRIYAIGGNSFDSGRYNILANCDEYNPETNEWTAKAPLPEPITRGGAVALDGKIHYLGGSNKYGNNDKGNLDTHYVYDPQTNSWAVGTPLPYKVSGNQCIVLNNKIMCLGGTINWPNPTANVISQK